MAYTITQTKALDLANGDLEYLDYDYSYDNLSQRHQSIMDRYLQGKPKSLTNIDKALYYLINEIVTNMHLMQMRPSHIVEFMHQQSDTFKSMDKCPIKLRVGLYQLLAKSIRIELLRQMYLTST